MIPRYAPEWTNHNPSDPGITLIELAAWMTDLLIYRLNQVPDKNYVAFLNLLGIKLRAPRAARALVRFTLVEGTVKQRVPRGIQISTPQATEEHTVTFETARDIVVCAARPDRCFSYVQRQLLREQPLHRSGAQHRRPAVRGVRRRAAHRPLPVPVRPPAGQLRRGLAAAGVPRRARARRPRPGAVPGVGVLGGHAVEGARAGADRGRSRRDRVPRAAAVRAHHGAPHRGPVDARPAGRDPRVGRRTPRSTRSGSGSRSWARDCCRPRPTPTSTTTRS